VGRRVVITGIGLICGVGNTVPEVWSGLLAGKSGIAKITHFDASAFACQIAAEVKNFDPLNFIEKKELKKMGRFIHLALAATDEAMKMSGLQVTPETPQELAYILGQVSADSMSSNGNTRRYSRVVPGRYHPSSFQPPS